MSLPIQMADAVLQKIKEAFPGVQSERRYVPSLELKDTKETRIIVVPKDISYERASRSHNNVQVAVDVAVMRKFQKGDAAELDPLCDLVESILKLFDSKPLGDALCFKAQNVPIYAQEHYDKWRQFTSLITLTFLCVESISP
ncbi:MAG: hypothetical protein FWH27_14735 [Planctomycetaceae bacterium]|nr:hypothetical protein [Planctomycetaceae bacterium]